MKFLTEALRIGGQLIHKDRVIEVQNPYTGEVVGTVPKADVSEVRKALELAKAYRAKLSRYERSNILLKAADIVVSQTERISDLITLESGLCKKDSLYEAGRVRDVLIFGANAALQDDGQIFSCDITPHGRQRRVYTQRDPLLGVISAITPSITP